MLRGRGQQTRFVIGRRTRKAVRHDDAVAVAGKSVARRAEDAEALLPAFQ
jgi:hypothetical protein